ncbi:MAG: ImmA/IrrE family metallo-endopeptidase [Deltaproteobacteria bacterium]|nr:ImmA/IrrE family metallo-endopeptidase [Deltaproteobacteria bacterium]
MVAIARRPPAARFLTARALHHRLFHGARPTLLTRSNEWSQAASRAFAAELLAPEDALRAELGAGTEIDALSDRFDVAPLVIHHQLQNHGLASL